MFARTVESQRILSRTSSPRRQTPFTADTSDEVPSGSIPALTGDQRGQARSFQLDGHCEALGEILGIGEDDVVHSASKLFFAYGLGNAMTFPLSVGATGALWPHRPSPEGVFDMMRRHQPTIFYGVPSLYTALSRTRIFQRARLDRLRICLGGRGPAFAYW
jgi:acyl-CoA synthetase (AMP-forming)/AMP-acid ligase II